jgi:hypothetical protein
VAQLPRSPGVRMDGLPTVSLAGTAPGPVAAAAPAAAFGNFGDVAQGAGQAQYAIAMQAQRDAAEAQLRRDRLKAAALVAESRVALTRRMIELQQSAPPGADGFTAAWAKEQEAAFQGLNAALPETVRDEYAPDLIALGGQFEATALTFEGGAREQHNKELLATTADAYSNAVRLDPGQLQASLDQWALAVDSSGLPEAAKPALLRAGEGSIAEAAVRALNESDPAATRQMLDEGLFGDLLAPERLEILRNDNATELRRIEAEQRAAAVEARAGVDGILSMLRDGWNVQPELLAQARSAAAGDPVLAAELAQAEGLASWSRQLQASPPAAVEATVAGLRATIAAEGATEQAVAALEIAEGVQTRMAEGLARDPLGYANTTGMVELPPLDPGSRESWGARVGAATVTESLYGTPALPLTEMEIGRVAADWLAAAPDQQIATVDAIMAVDMPGDMRARLLDGISGSEPMMGLVASWVETGDAALRQTAEAMLAGRRTIAANPELKPTSSDVAGTMAGELEGALVADVDGRWRRLIRDGADALYVAGLQGATPESFDADRYEDALAAVTGGLTDINGRVTFLPPGYDEAAFDGWLAGLTDADLTTAQGGPHVLGTQGLRPLTAAEIAADWQLAPVGPGEFFVGATIGDRFEIAVTPNGDPYVLRAP